WPISTPRRRSRAFSPASTTGSTCRSGRASSPGSTPTTWPTATSKCRKSRGSASTSISKGSKPISGRPGRCSSRPRSGTRPSSASGGRTTAGRSDLHPRIVRAAAAFGGDPGDVLGGVLDVAGLAVDAVGGVDAEDRGATGFGDLIDAGGAVERGGLTVERQVFFDGDGGVGKLQLDRLVFIVGDVGEKYRSRAVEGGFCVGAWIAPGRLVGEMPQCSVVGLLV